MQSIRLAGVLVFLVATSSTEDLQAAQQSSRVEEVLQAQVARMRAVTTQDVRTLDTLLADELRYCHGSSDIETKAEYINTVRTGRIRWMTMTVENTKTQMYGDVAVVTGDLRNTIGAAQTPNLVRSIEVWVRRGGRWQLANFQATLVDEPKR